MAQLNEYQVIVKPVMTEKSLTSAAEGKYTFEVDVRANKLQIAEAVSMVFDVDVVKVNVINSWFPAKELTHLKYSYLTCRNS